MPLLTIGGRGATTFPITIHIDQRWTISKEVNPGHDAYHFGHSSWWSEDDGGNHTITAGRVRIRRGILKNSSGWQKLLTRITFTAPDGTEYELRDQSTGGQPSTPGGSPFDRGQVFVSADGTAATFVSDFDVLDAFYPSDEEAQYPAYGYMMLRDGTGFRIDEDKISWMRDRNGNKLTFAYDSYKRVTSVTDSLNRQVTITYDNNYVNGVSYDQISYKGFGGAARTIKIGHSLRSQAMRSDIIDPTGPLFAGLTGVDNSNPPVVNYIELPDGRRYQLQYNAYAELARIVLPTGGAIEYDWANGLTDGATNGLVQTGDWYIYRRVIERRLYPDGGSGTAYQSRMTYSRPETTSTNAGYVLVDQYDLSGTLLAHSQHYLYGSPRASFDQKATDYGAWQDGKEYKTETFDTNGTTLLRRVENSFEQRASVNWWTGTSATAPPNDVRPTQIITTLADTNQVSKQTLGYDDSVPFNNQNNVKDYDFGSGASGVLLRETRTTYLTDASYTGTSVHIRNLPMQVSIYDTGGVERARTTFEYDNYAADSNHAALWPRSNVSGFCAVVTSPTQCDNSNPAAVLLRGNATGTTKYLLSGGSVTGSVSNYSQYDVAGNVLKTIDGRGFATNLFYEDCFGAPNGEAHNNSAPTELGGLSTFALVTKVTNALNQSAYAQFDYYLGRPVDGEDPNDITASGYFDDLLDRPTQVQRAVGTGVQNQTTFSYDDVNRIITSTSDRDATNDNVLVSKVLYDQMGRTVETRQYEGGGNYIAVQIQYDTLGRAYKTSNPFRPWNGESAVFTTTVFDALGRARTVTTPDNAVVSTNYSGNSVTVIDQAGKQRQSVTDALGRLKQVYEAPDDLINYNYLTSYAYDVLDNLNTVTQGTQTRTFVYDSLKRLTSATNPESGTVSYQYDSNGNLVVKTDSRSVSTHFSYDVLNRLTRRWYNGSSATTATTNNSPVLPSGVGASDEVNSYYDSQSLPAGAPTTFSRGFSTGRLVAQTYGTSSSAGDYYGHDSLGRQSLKIQQTGGINYLLTPTYNLAGAVTALAYPSGHTITNSYDSVGRLSGFAGNLGDGGNNRTYSTGIIYSSLGGMAKEQFGTTTPIYNKLFYNVRGQLAEIRESTSYTGPTDTTWNRGAIINHYSDQCWGMCSGRTTTATSSIRITTFPTTSRSPAITRSRIRLPTTHSIVCKQSPKTTM